MEEEWELVDISGPFQAWAMVQENNTLIYSVGSHIIVWNLDSDTKYHLRCHEFNITSIIFHPNREHFITIEASKDPFISVWDWTDLSQVCIKFLPHKPRKLSLEYLDCCVYENFLYVLESEKEGGYRILLWEWTGPSLEFIDIIGIEKKEKAFKIRTISGTHIFVAEKTFIKIWDVSDKAFITKRLYFKSQIIDVEYSDELCAFFILLGSFSFIIVNSLGVILKKFLQSYYSFCVCSEYLFLGGTSLQVYSIKSYIMISEIVGNSLKIIQILVNGGNLACVKYENSTVQIMDLENGNVMRVTAYHGTKVVGLSWSVLGNFASFGDENCVYVWEKQETGWGLEAFDMGKEEVTALDLCGEIMALGFYSGNVSVYDEYMHVIACQKVCNVKVTDIKFSQSGVLVCSFSNSLIVVFNSTYSQTDILLQSHPKPLNDNIKISLCELIDYHDSLILVCSIKDPQTLSIHRVSKKSSCKAIGFTNISVESNFTDFKMHISGKYVIVSLDIDHICLYEIITNRLVGVIEATGVLSIDTSGLYISCLQISETCKVQIYELGTGELVTEMSRIANAINLQWSYDGKLLAITSTDGKIEIWKIPEIIRLNIEKMLTTNEKDIWKKFPIEYENKTIRKKNNMIKIPRDAYIDNSTFADKIVSLIPKQKMVYKPTEYEMPNFRTSEIVGTKNSDREPVVMVQKVNKFYMPMPSNDTINSEQEAKVSYIHKPQSSKNDLNLIDSPVSLAGKNNQRRKVHEPMLKRNDIEKDEPISFSKTSVKRNSLRSENRNRFSGQFNIDIDRNFE